MASLLDLDESAQICAPEEDIVAVFPSMQAARSYLERTAEWALKLLDDLDGDTDTEPYLAGSQTDLEQEDEHDEPSLGSLGGTASGEFFGQGQWAGGSDQDYEGHDADAEPSLGWTTTGAFGTTTDRELDPAEDGIADHGGLQEQMGL